MRSFPRPTVLVSRCLEFDKVRYNGQVIPSQIVRDLIPFVDFIKVCPEVEIGLGVPRDTLRIVRQNGEHRLIQPKTGEDLTERMNSFTTRFLDNIDHIDGFIYKGLSPSMGVDDVKVYSGVSMSPVIERGTGLFAGQVIVRYEGYPIEENERLRNSHIRHHFLTHLYAFTNFRYVKETNSYDELLSFHKNNRFFFLSYSNSVFTEMSELLRREIEIGQMIKDYESLLKQLLKKPGSLALKMDALRNMFFAFECENSAEISFFEEMLGRFSNNRISWDAVIEVMRMFASRSFGEDAYEDTFLYPYPEELKAPADDKRDKDYWVK